MSQWANKELCLYSVISTKLKCTGGGIVVWDTWMIKAGKMFDCGFLSGHLPTLQSGHTSTWMLELFKFRCVALRLWSALSGANKGVTKRSAVWTDRVKRYYELIIIWLWAQAVQQTLLLCLVTWRNLQQQRLAVILLLLKLLPQLW